MGTKKKKGNGCGHANYEANKKRKSLKHQDLLDRQATLKEQRLEMLEDVKAKFYKLKIGEIKKKFGTLNIHRLQDILDGTWESTSWFKNREALKLVKAEGMRLNYAKSRQKPRFTKRSNIQNSSREQKIQKVSSGSTT